METFLNSISSSVSDYLSFMFLIFFSLYRDNSVDKLINALEELWETFLNSISSSVSDYLSVEHLGLILNRLAEQGTYLYSQTCLKVHLKISNHCL